MRVITLAGSPRFPSRSSSLLEYAREKLNGLDVEVYHWNLQNFAPEDLLYARFDSPALKTFTEQLQQADGLIVATPVYKAAYSGALKTLLDLLPERALQGKVVLPLATGGTVAHLLAVDYALKPVLSALKAQEILHGVFADDSQVIDYHHRFLIADSVFPVTGGFLPAPYQYCLSDSLYVTLQARILQQPQK